MSQNIVPLKTVQVLEPRVKINDEREYAILKGGSEISWKPVISTSYSNTSAQFSAPPPNPGIIVDRKVYLKMPITVDFVGTAPVGQNLLQSGYDSFRAFPLSNIISTLSVTINNTTVSVNMSDVINPLLRYHTPQNLREFEYSMTPTEMDQSQNYSDIVNTIRNPLAPYGDSYEMARGGFPLNVFTNTNTNAHVEADLTEPIYLSPFYFGHGNSSGFIGIQTMDFNFSFANNLARVWSHASGSGSTINSITVTLGQPTLIFTYITPKELVAIPRSVSYPYFNVDRYPTDYNQVIPANDTRQISSANIQLNSIPRRMYICARKRNADLTFNDTDTFLSIEQISVNWNNRSGLLSSATKQDLYNISKKNGVNLSWTQWSGGPSFDYVGATNNSFGTVGSVLCLEFGTDIGLNDYECPGLLGTYQLQMNVNVKNVNQSSGINPTLYIIIISEGTFTIIDQRSVSQVGVVTKQDVLDAHSSPFVNYEMVEHVYGGNFFSGLKQFFSDLGSGVMKALPYIQKGIGIAKDIAPLLLAAGKPSKSKRGGMLVGGCEGGSYVGGCNSGSYAGGKMMSRAMLKKRLIEDY